VAKLTKDQRRIRKKRRVRGRVRGISSKPRLCVFRSNKHTYAQLIDDDAGNTLVSSSSLSLREQGGGLETARKVGECLAVAAVEKGVREVVFDRNGFQFHGRVKAVAEGARSNGLKF